MMQKLKSLYTYLSTFDIETITLRSLLVVTSIYSVYIFILYFFAYRAGTFHSLPKFFFVLIIPILLFFAYITLKIFQRPEIGILAITFFLPFERIGSLYHVISVNVRLSQVFAVVTFLAVIYQYGIRKKFSFSFKKDFSLLILMAFVAINFASLAHSASKLRSLEILFFDIFVFLVYILVSNLLVTRKILEKAVLILISLGFVLGIYGLYQFAAGNTHLPLAAIGLRYGYSNALFFHIPRIQGTALEPLYWGNFLLIPIALSFSTFISGISKFTQKLSTMDLFAGATFAILMTNIILSFSRGALYASIVVIAGVIAMHVIRTGIKTWNLKKIGIIILPFILVPILCAGLIKIFHAPVTLETFRSRATEIQDQGGRQLSTSESFKIFQQNSLLGVGVGGFSYSADSLNGQEITPENIKQILSLNNTHFAIVNNQYLEVLTETGIFGVIVFIAFFAYIILSALRAFLYTKDEGLQTILIGLLLALVGILVQYVSFSTLYIMHIWVLLALLSATTYNITHNIWGTGKKK